MSPKKQRKNHLPTTINSAVGLAQLVAGSWGAAITFPKSSCLSEDCGTCTGFYFATGFVTAAIICGIMAIMLAGGLGFIGAKKAGLLKSGVDSGEERLVITPPGAERDIYVSP